MVKPSQGPASECLRIGFALLVGNINKEIISKFLNLFFSDDEDGDDDDGVVSVSSRHSGLNDDVEEEDRDDVSISSRHSGDAGDGDDDVKDDNNNNRSPLLLLSAPLRMRRSAGAFASSAF